MTIRGGPPLSNTRTSLPQIKSKFDLEPNPFEQSFKDNPLELEHEHDLSPNHHESLPARNSLPIHSNTNSPSLNHLLNANSNVLPARSPNSNSPIPIPIPIPNHLDHHFNHHPTLSPPVIRSSPGGSLVKVQLPGISSITYPPIINQPSSNMPPAISPFSWPFPQISAPHSPKSSPALTSSAPTLIPTTTPASAPPRHGPAHSGLSPLIDIGNSAAHHQPEFTPATQALIALFSSTHDIQPTPASNLALQPPVTSSSSSKPPDLPKLIPVSLPQSAPNPAPNPAPSIQHHDQAPSSPSASSAIPFDLPAHIQKSTLNPNSPPSSSSHHLPSPVSANPSLSARPFNTLHSALPPKLPLSHARPLVSSSLAFPDPAGSPPSSLLKLDSASTAHSISTSPSVPPLHSISPVALPAPPASFPCSATGSRSSLSQLTPLSTIALSAALAPSPHSAVDATLAPPPLLPHPNGPGPMDEHYNSNPLYLLTVAHEASAQLGHFNHAHQSHEPVDDATVTAAAALTGLGSSSGSRYSSPGPNPAPNGTAPQLQQLGNQVAHSMALKRSAIASNTSSPTLSAPRTTAGAALGAALMTRGTMGGPAAADDRARFGPGTSSGAYSAAYGLGEGTSTGTQSGGGSGTSSGKRKGKRRKEPGEEETGSGLEPEAQEGQQPKAVSRSKPGEQSSPLMGAGRTGSSSAKSRTGGKPKKGKKPKMEEGSVGDESDGREGFWGLDDEMGYQPNNTDDGSGGGGQGSEGGERTGGGNHGLAGPGGNQQAGGRPETEEEKRKNFLERNRQAALKCRQRKKAWLANLQSKVEYLSTENESLQETISRLQEEIESIRSILVSHQDCPISVNVQVLGSGGGQGKSRTIGELVGNGGESVSACVGGLLVQQQQGGRTGGGVSGQTQARQPVGLGQSGNHGAVHPSTARVAGNANVNANVNGNANGNANGMAASGASAQHHVLVGQHLGLQNHHSSTHNHAPLMHQNHHGLAPSSSGLHGHAHGQIQNHLHHPHHHQHALGNPGGGLRGASNGGGSSSSTTNPNAVGGVTSNGNGGAGSAGLASAFGY